MIRGGDPPEGQGSSSSRKQPAYASYNSNLAGSAGPSNFCQTAASSRLHDSKAGNLRALPGSISNRHPNRHQSSLPCSLPASRESARGSEAAPRVKFLAHHDGASDQAIHEHDFSGRHTAHPQQLLGNLLGKLTDDLHSQQLESKVELK